MKTLRSYLAILRGAFQVSLMYRFGFIFNILGNIIYMAVTYYLWSSIYANSTILRGLTFNETFIYVALGSTVFILLKTYADWFISYEIREGQIATYLTKPIDYQFYSLASSLGFGLGNLLAITIPTVLMITLVFKIPFQLGPGTLLFPLSLFLAFLISFNFDYLVGVTCFYTESIWGISISKEILISVMSGALIPLQFFPDVVQKILMWLPFQTIYYTPLMMVTRPDQSWLNLTSMIAIQLFWLVVTFFLTRFYYNRAIRVVRIAGG